MEMIKNKQFVKDGYLLVPQLIPDIKNYHCDPLKDQNGNRVTGHLKYLRKDRVTHNELELQVPGSFARQNFPEYKNLHYIVRKKIENILGIDLLPTYYFERFYFSGQELTRHTDRPSCEISVTLQISTNSKKQWPIWFERDDGVERSVVMNDGDGVIYMGCDRTHWREPLQSRYNKVERKWREFRKKEDDTYHHQIFLHYVNSQGPFVHYANDMIR